MAIISVLIGCVCKTVLDTIKLIMKKLVQNLMHILDLVCYTFKA